jgi:hypothetical protein
VNRNSFYTKFAAGSENTQCNFTAVGYNDFVEHSDSVPKDDVESRVI